MTFEVLADPVLLLSLLFDLLFGCRIINLSLVGCVHVQCHAIAQFVSRNHGTSLTKKTASHMKSQARTNKNWRRQGTQPVIDATERRSTKDESKLKHHSILVLFTFIHNTMFLKCQKSSLTRRDKCKHRATLNEGSST